jgi:hypothetical protein
MPEPKSCFVICPIGDEGSPVRKRSDQILKHIISPIAKDLGYETVRADLIDKPGIITRQVIDHLENDDLVIADLADYNPNVYYELAVRHAVRKPVVQIRKKGQPLPFDVVTSRTIELDFPDPDSMDQCKEQLRKQISAVERDPSEADNPISNAIDLQAARKSDKPLERQYADIKDSIQDLKSTMLDAIRKQAPLSTSIFGISPGSAGSTYQPGATEPGTFRLAEVPLTQIPVVDFTKYTAPFLVSAMSAPKKDEKKREPEQKSS